MRLSRRLLWPLVVVGAALALDRLTRADEPEAPPARRPRPPDVRLHDVPMEIRSAPAPAPSPSAPATPPAATPTR